MIDDPDKPFKLVVHRIENMQDRVVSRHQYATEQEAVDASQKMPLNSGESVEIIMPLPFPTD